VIAQELESLWWKILRLNDDGTIPSDNPFPDSPVYSLWHRNPQGIAWNDSGDLFMSTHGPSWEFGLYAKDRVDYITAWTDYGWPTAYGPDQWYPNPLAYWPDSATPPGWMAFWNGSLFLATLKSAALVQLDIEQTDEWYELISENRWFEWEYGRLRDVTVWPDGNLYILTSNGDGRSGGIGWDDVILKVEKK
jgi:quinoprotein glucose dehydrogenase